MLVCRDLFHFSVVKRARIDTEFKEPEIEPKRNIRRIYMHPKNKESLTFNNRPSRPSSYDNFIHTVDIWQPYFE